MCENTPSTADPSLTGSSTWESKGIEWPFQWCLCPRLRELLAVSVPQGAGLGWPIPGPVMTGAEWNATFVLSGLLVSEATVSID